MYVLLYSTGGNGVLLVSLRISANVREEGGQISQGRPADTRNLDGGDELAQLCCAYI